MEKVVLCVRRRKYKCQRGRWGQKPHRNPLQCTTFTWDAAAFRGLLDMISTFVKKKSLTDSKRKRREEGTITLGRPNHL